MRRPTVASLSPAATDILVGIGAADHLVAVSNYDTGKPGVASLPPAGDYLTVDWERIGRLRPDVLVLQAREASAPEGFKQRAAALGIRPVYIHIDTLADISASVTTIGDAIDESKNATAAERAMRGRLDAVARSVEGRPRVRTLVVTAENGAGAAGPGTFLDDLLTIAGGENAVAAERKAYPGLDREKIVALRPQAVLHLLPDQPAPVVEEARRYWASMPDVPAVKSGRVYYLTDPSVMHPGLKVGDVAEAFAARLHPDRFASAGAVRAPNSAAVQSRTANRAVRPDRVSRHPKRSERISTFPRALTVEILRCAQDDVWEGRRGGEGTPSCPPARTDIRGFRRKAALPTLHLKAWLPS